MNYSQVTAFPFDRGFFFRGGRGGEWEEEAPRIKQICGVDKPAAKLAPEWQNTGLVALCRKGIAPECDQRGGPATGEKPRQAPRGRITFLSSTLGQLAGRGRSGSFAHPTLQVSVEAANRRARGWAGSSSSLLPPPPSRSPAPFFPRLRVCCLLSRRARLAAAGQQPGRDGRGRRSREQQTQPPRAGDRLKGGGGGGACEGLQLLCKRQPSALGRVRWRGFRREGECGQPGEFYFSLLLQPLPGGGMRLSLPAKADRSCYSRTTT